MLDQTSMILETESNEFLNIWIGMNWYDLEYVENSQQISMILEAVEQRISLSYEG